jgi:hypothetical protein
LRVFSLTKIYSKYIKNIGIKLVSLKNMFQYKSNDTNFTQYNQVLVALFVRSNFALECACTLFLEKEVVYVRNMLCNLCICFLPMFLSWSVSCNYALLGLVVILDLERDG